MILVRQLVRSLSLSKGCNQLTLSLSKGANLYHSPRITNLWQLTTLTQQSFENEFLEVANIY
ncbi:hypothetical protein SAMN02745108_00420 [Fibrobacter intestinalis]|uniref:Uncharacterized protein n=1 Tax=Fibrobacter intestinalis TaxID=28122 RepID=A0A1T4KB84_9BACT|nr:hypothetical protein BGW94_2560 [Fibrobacter sp. NR9]SJZ39671.1 hypothetical protein SAMN02745108_00420 [Fibrobacter intestinalis]